MFNRHVVQRRHYYAIPQSPFVSLRAFATSLVPPSIPSAFSSLFASDHSSSRVRQQKLHQLLESIQRRNKPYRVWDDYASLLGLVTTDQLPRELHELVLTKCTPSIRHIRSQASSAQASNPRHPYSSRFQSIVRNILSSGSVPSIEAYNHILHHLAVCGDHSAALALFQDIIDRGVKPHVKSYTLCLLALAHRLLLPISVRDRPRLIESITNHLHTIIAHMKTNSVPVTQVNIDLMLRIFKETLDYPAFVEMMKWAYAIDLTYPDRPLLDTQGNIQSPATHFSTAALNTTLDTLGRFANISKLIQAFEVFTAPLPYPSQLHFSNAFEEDDDDFGVSSSPEPVPYQPPSATPNSTTFTILLRHLGQENRPLLLRHYFLSALSLDHQVAQAAYIKTNRGRLKPPTFSFNHRMLMAAYGYANRSHNVAFMKWISDRMPALIKRRRKSLQSFVAFRERCIAHGRWNYLPQFERSPDFSPKLDTNPRQAEQLRREHHIMGKTRADQVYQAALSDAQSQSQSPVYTKRSKTAPIVPDLDLSVIDIDSQSPSPSSPSDNIKKRRSMDVDVHISILERDIYQFTQFQHLLQASISRAVQRLKERLGRRVWKTRSIYLGTHGRRHVSRTGWQNIANIQPRKGPPLLGPAGKQGQHPRPELWRYWAHRRAARKGAKNSTSGRQLLQSTPLFDENDEPIR